MKKKKKLNEVNDPKDYLPPKIEVVDVMVEKGFGEGDEFSKPVTDGGNI